MTTESMGAPAEGSVSSNESSAPSTSSTPSSAPESNSGSTPSQGSQSAPESDFDISKYLDKEVSVKVNGQDKKVSVAKMMQDYQLAEASNNRFQKASEIEKQHKSLMDSLKSDPAKVLKDMGLDPLEFSQRQLEEFIKSQEMTPEQKELAELRRFKEQQDLTRQEQQQLQEQQAFEAQVEIHRQEYSTKIVESMDKHSLPRDPAVVSMVADYLYNASEKGIDLPVEVAARLVKEDLTNNVKALLGQMNGDALFGMLGEDLARKIREYDLGRVGSKNSKPAQPSQSRPQMKSDTPMTLEQINKKMREELGL